MDLEAVMDEVADRLGTIAGLRVYAWPADSVSVPAAVVGYPERIVFDATYGRGMDRIEALPVWLVVGKASTRAARTKVAAYCNGSGAKSVKTVLESGTPTAFHTLRVAEAEFDSITITIAGTEYIAARFTLDITGQGS